jgi:hypothetical protein
MEQLAQAAATIAGVFAFAGFLAFIVERLVEKFVKPPLRKGGWHGVSAYAALLLGVVFSWGFGLDLATSLAVAVGASPFVPWAGYLLTGLLVGGGGNFMRDVWPVAAIPRGGEQLLVVDDVGTVLPPARDAG